MTPPKACSKSPVTGSEERETQELFNKEFKIIVLKMFRELQENADRQFNNNRKAIQE